MPNDGCSACAEPAHRGQCILHGHHDYIDLLHLCIHTDTRTYCTTAELCGPCKQYAGQTDSQGHPSAQLPPDLSPPAHQKRGTRPTRLALGTGPAIPPVSMATSTVMHHNSQNMHSSRLSHPAAHHLRKGSEVPVVSIKTLCNNELPCHFSLGRVLHAGASRAILINTGFIYLHPHT